MRHPETSFQLHGAGTSRHRSKHARGALVALAALLIGTATLCAQEAGTSELRPAVPTLPGSSTPEATAPSPQPTSPGTSPRVVAPPPSVTPPAQPDAAATPAPSAAPGSPPAPATVPPETAPSASPSGTANTPPVADPAPASQAPSTPAASAPATTATATLPHDLSPWGMFMAADIIVKSVMLGLAFASVVTWTIWLAKALELFAARVKARRALRCLERATTLAEATETGRRWPKRGPVAALAQAALLETSRSDGLDAEGVKERAAVALHRIEARAGRTMSRGTGLLATIGSTAPFVGLFGTVWGIMNSFIGISQANTTNLAVVAPGIAEALLATAIGLVAAIPAVIIYNVFARSIAGYRAVLADASAEILRHLSRDLDRGARRAQPAAGPSVLQAAE